MIPPSNVGVFSEEKKKGWQKTYMPLTAIWNFLKDIDEMIL